MGDTVDCKIVRILARVRLKGSGTSVNITSEIGERGSPVARLARELSALRGSQFVRRAQ